MRDFFINMLAKKAGLPKVPESVDEFFQMASLNPQFKEDLRKVEQMGIVKRGDDGRLNIIDQDKVDQIVQNFVMNFLLPK